MFNVKMVRLITCSCIVMSLGSSLNFSAIAAEPMPTEKMATVDNSEHLAKEILVEMGLPQRYNLYLQNSIEISVSPEMANNEQLMTWFQDLFKQEAGWQHLEAFYLAQLQTNFSETELRELLTLLQNALMKRLVQTEIDGYLSATEQRRLLFFQLWDNYNNGQFIPPQHIFE